MGAILRFGFRQVAFGGGLPTIRDGSRKAQRGERKTRAKRTVKSPRIKDT